MGINLTKERFILPIRPPAQISFPLDIPNVDIISTQRTTSGKFNIKIESNLDTTICSICQQEIKCNYGHGEEIQLRHLPILGLETILHLRPRRAQCKTCFHNPTTTQTLDWYTQRSPFTRAYEDYLMKSLIGSTVKDVSLKEKLGYDAVLGVLERQIPKEIDWDKIDKLGTIGIDEVATKKGHNGYRAIVTARQDDGTTIVLGVLEDRKKRA